MKTDSAWRDRMRVVVLPKEIVEGLLAEQAIREEAEEDAARLAEGTLRVSWGLLNWAKAQMSYKAS